VALYLSSAPVESRDDARGEGLGGPGCRRDTERRPADPAGGAPAVTSAEPPSNTSTITTVGGITVVDVALGIASLSNELRHQHAEATAHGERLLLETTISGSGCTPCQGVAAALSDSRMQTALDKVRLVRVDREPFEEIWRSSRIPSKPWPASSPRFEPPRRRRVSTAANGRTTSPPTAPVLGSFVRGSYGKRRSPWKKLPAPAVPSSDDVVGCAQAGPKARAE
jgi:hypothetical protein